MDYESKWKAERERRAFLALADGTVFHGVAFGAAKDALGEVVFNTGMSGYQEILTDPSYAGQFVTLTAAEIGNYGINGADVESRALFLSGLVIGDLTPPSNWRSEKSLDDYLKENGVPGIYGVDTRALTIHLREHGNQKAYLCTGGAQLDTGGSQLAATESEAIAKAREWVGLDGQDYAAKVTRENVEVWKCENVEAINPPHIVCYDFGVKTNILRSIAAWADVTVVPAKTSAEDVLAFNPDGIFLSNGPADPAAVTYARRHLRHREHPETAGQSPHHGNLPWAPAPVARVRRKDGPSQVRPPRLQPSREEPRNGQGGDHKPEPQLCRHAGVGSSLPGGHAYQSQRRLHRGRAPQDASGVFGAVPSRVLPRSARQQVPL